VQVARAAVGALAKHDGERAQDALAELPPEELLTAAVSLAYVLAAVERQLPGSVDAVWESAEAQVAGVEVDRGLRDLFGDERPEDQS
jgi:hypothetical protein